MRVGRSVTEKGSAETLAYFVEPRGRTSIFATTVGGKLALGDMLRVSEMTDAASALSAPHTLRNRVLGRHLVPDTSRPGRFAVQGCKVDIDTTFEGSARKEKGLAEVDASVIFELTPPSPDQCRMN